MRESDIIISGAGPTGLAAALFLSERGLRAKVYDKHSTPSTYSKAFGVNSRTLTLLKSSGITDQLLKLGHKMYAVNIWRNGKHIVRVDLSKVKSEYNFMLIYSQAKTEKVLTEALEARGIQVKRGTAVENVRLTNNNTTADLQLVSEPLRESATTSCLLAADGSHSTIRNNLGIQFSGSAYEEPWYFHDLELETPLNANEAHVFLLENSPLFMLRLEENLWRVGGSLANCLDYLPAGTKIGKSYWDTSFVISHKITHEFSKGPVYFAGDAAHIHSPMGARGMNLGIEDAYVFANLAATSNLAAYATARRTVDTKVVHRVEMMSEFPRGKNPIARLIRNEPWLLKLILPFAEPSIRRWALGLDHRFYKPTQTYS